VEKRLLDVIYYGLLVSLSLAESINKLTGRGKTADIAHK
jgi:hypothetical protein